MSEDVNGICQKWWAHEISAETGPARKTRAQLGRADSPLKALGVLAVHRLNTTLSANGFDLRQDPARLALIAVALAHVKERGPNVARAFGARAKPDDPPALSPIRFNALIRATTPEALWRPLTRALAVIKGVANPGALAADLFYWSEPTRTRWCFDYYGETTAAPMKLETET